MKKYLFLISSISLIVWSCAALIPIDMIPAKDIIIEATPERISRGNYLANNVTGCMSCHSGTDPSYFGRGLPIEGKEGAGGFHIKAKMGPMGSMDIYTPNITPAAIGDWTDGELLRSITAGVNNKGEPLFPIMSYESYHNMDKEDAYSIVAYIKSLKPIDEIHPKKKIKGMIKLIERSMPKPWYPKPKPERTNTVQYGKYLAKIGDCYSCHSTWSRPGKYKEGMEFAGGNDFHLPDGVIVRSSNITPDMETGIGNRSKENFIGLFKSFKEPIKLPVGQTHENTVMAWSSYAGMTDDDLGAIYDYLQTIKPVNHVVEKYPTK